MRILRFKSDLISDAKCTTILDFRVGRILDPNTFFIRFLNYYARNIFVSTICPDRNRIFKFERFLSSETILSNTLRQHFEQFGNRIFSQDASDSEIELEQ